METKPFDFLKILVVDDEPEIQRVISRYLAFTVEFQDIRLSLAGSFYEAMQKIEEDPPHIVLQDLNLPDGNGLQLIRQVKSVHPLVQFIIITGASDLDRVMESVVSGAVDYVKKPIQLEKLGEILQDTKRRCLRWGEMFQEEYLAERMDLVMEPEATRE